MTQLQRISAFLLLGTSLACLPACNQNSSEAKEATVETQETSEANLTSDAEETVKTAEAHGHDDHAHDHGHNHDHSMTVPANVEHALTEAPGDHVVGAGNAPVTMIVYASVTCGHCANWFNTEWPGVKKDLVDTGKVRFVFREFPTSPPELSIPGFVIANCGTTGTYMERITHQFAEQENLFAAVKEGKGREAYDALAAKAGLPNEEAVQTCFEDKSHLERIEKSMQRAQAGGIEGVPGFIIDGSVYKGKQSTADLTAFVDGLISAKNTGQ